MAVYNLKHAMYAGAGAGVGAIVGYLLGIVLYIVLLASSVFAPNTAAGQAVVVAAESAGIFPILFAIAFAAIGFFGGFYISMKDDEANGKA
jgi:uncharacterized membrane protein